MLPGEKATVLGFDHDSEFTKQLLRLGLTPGTEITLKRKAPLGDPVEIGFRGFSLAIRPNEAKQLLLVIS